MTANADKVHKAEQLIQEVKVQVPLLILERGIACEITRDQGVT